MAPGSQDRPAGPGAHPQTEAVRLGPTTVVGLERALAHSWAPGLVAIVHAHPEVALMLGTARCQGRWRVVVGGAEGPGDAAGQDGEHKAGTAQQPSTTRPGHGTGGPRPGSNGSGPGSRHRRPVIVAGHSARTGATRPGRGRTPRPRRRKKSLRVVDNRLLAVRQPRSVSRVAGRVPSRTTSPHPIAIATVPAAVAQVQVGQTRTDRGNLCTQAVDDRVDGDRRALPGPGPDGRRQRSARCSVRSHRRPAPGR